MPRAAVAYVMAFAAAALTGAAAGWLLAATTVRVPGTTIPAAYPAAVLAGLAVFQMVFGLAAGLWRGWRYWAVALPLAGSIGTLALTLTLARVVTPGWGGAGGLIALFLFGAFALRATARTTPRAPSPAAVR